MWDTNENRKFRIHLHSNIISSLCFADDFVISIGFDGMFISSWSSLQILHKDNLSIMDKFQNLYTFQSQNFQSSCCYNNKLLYICLGTEQGVSCLFLLYKLKNGAFEFQSYSNIELGSNFKTLILYSTKGKDGFAIVTSDSILLNKIDEKNSFNVTKVNKISSQVKIIDCQYNYYSNVFLCLIEKGKILLINSEVKFFLKRANF